MQCYCEEIIRKSNDVSILQGIKANIDIAQNSYETCLKQKDNCVGWANEAVSLTNGGAMVSNASEYKKSIIQTFISLSAEVQNQINNLNNNLIPQLKIEDERFHEHEKAEIDAWQASLK